MIITGTSKKNPSCGLYFGLRIWPTIALELGYGETDDELLSDTDLLLEGSKGNIGFVVLVIIERVASDGRIEAGYVELHKYSVDTGKRVIVGDRMVCLFFIVPCLVCTTTTNAVSVLISSTCESCTAMHSIRLG